MVIRLGSILFDYVAGRGLRCAVHSALCLGPHGLYDVLKVITPRTRPEYPTQRARYPQVCQILTPREQSSWSPSPFHGLFAHRLACQRAMAMPPDTTAVAVRRSWRGSGVACFWATSLEKLFGGVIAISYPFGREHGRHRAVKRREFIALLGDDACDRFSASGQRC